LTVHNVRNFEYWTATQFTPRYETRNYDLANLRALDLFVNYWGSPLMAHPILSFDFGPQGHLCFSIETRPERGKAYSTVGGLYRQFELIYIAADERDVVRLRTNFKGEDLYLYRLVEPPREVRARFMEYIQRLNELYVHPAWYNAVTANCTTTFGLSARRPAACPGTGACCSMALPTRCFTSAILWRVTCLLRNSKAAPVLTNAPGQRTMRRISLIASAPVYLALTLSENLILHVNNKPRLEGGSPGEYALRV
jgi:hypothetical protein